MKVSDLVDNDEFSFNVCFRLCKYTPTDDDVDHVDVLYESGRSKPIPYEYYDLYIGAINQTGTIIDIECY